jgi:hypothetical protein
MSALSSIFKKTSTAVKKAAASKEVYKPSYIIVHHSAAKSPVPQFEAINEWHKDREFPESELGFFAGYHRVIEKDGTVVVARNDHERDCDALGHNYDSLSVCLVGHYDMEVPPPAQLASLAKVLQEWCQVHSLTAADIHIHREFAATNCPGIRISRQSIQILYLQAEIKRLNKELAAISSLVS